MPNNIISRDALLRAQGFAQGIHDTCVGLLVCMFVTMMTTAVLGIWSEHIDFVSREGLSRGLVMEFCVSIMFWLGMRFSRMINLEMTNALNKMDFNNMICPDQNYPTEKKPRKEKTDEHRPAVR